MPRKRKPIPKTPQPAGKWGWWEVTHTLRDTVAPLAVLAIAGGAKLFAFVSGMLDTLSTDPHTTTIVGQDGTCASFGLLVFAAWRFYKRVSANNKPSA